MKTLESEKIMFTVRVECWNSRGGNIGWVATTYYLKNIDEAIDKARDAWKRNSFAHSVQVTISVDDRRVWMFLNGKAGLIDSRGKFIDEE